MGKWPGPSRVTVCCGVHEAAGDGRNGLLREVALHKYRANGPTLSAEEPVVAGTTSSEFGCRARSPFLRLMAPAALTFSMCGSWIRSVPWPWGISVGYCERVGVKNVGETTNTNLKATDARVLASRGGHIGQHHALWSPGGVVRRMSNGALGPLHEVGAGARVLGIPVQTILVPLFSVPVP